MSTKKMVWAVMALAIVLAACAPAATAVAPIVETVAPIVQTVVVPATPGPTPTANPMDALIAACKQEGAVTLIADPRDWANYGTLIDTFGSRYGVSVGDLNPTGSSQEELDAIKANEGNKGPQAPDTVDIGYTLANSAKSGGLLAPYKVAGWNDIPIKDPDGYWWEEYYGVMTFEVNAKLVKDVPQDWSDLLKPEYKGMVALAGNPTGSNQAIMAVYAAALANGGSLDNAQPGLDFFAKLNKAGNFVPVIAHAASLAQGETPIVLRWDYLGLADRDTLAGNPPVTVVVPKSATIAGPYVAGISAYAPHPNCAKLWQEFLFSDEGQVDWLRGYVHPARFASLISRNVVAADVLSNMPSAAAYSVAVIPSLDQITTASSLITKGWDSAVGVTVK
ncbi:MAG: ABC transporter substrate-binding protein [Anaerolineales bacterium]|jgi:putative spermidine/putrescine transport system substrate-binding protein